jgi:hypothetical protein
MAEQKGAYKVPLIAGTTTTGGYAYIEYIRV